MNDPNAVVVFNALWSEPINVFDHYAQYLGLDPNKEYVAQAMLTNIYDNTGYSEKVDFKTFAFPQITIEPVTARSYDAYIYANITLDTGDSLSSLGLYADDGDTQQPKDDPERVAGSLVRFDDETGIATFHLTGLTPETDYDVQVFTRSGAGEKWSGKSAFTTLREPERAVVETRDATSVRNTKAMMNATITDMKYSYVLEQGFVYSETEQNPIRSFGDPEITEVLVPITSQTAPSAIAGLADGLTPNTPNYYKSLVRNNVGTSYGGVYPFTTPDDPQVDTRSGTTDKTPSSITLYGEVLSTGGLTPTLRGVVYTRLPITPALGSSGSQFALNAVTDNSTGQFSADLTGLSAGTLYTYRAFIHNQYGTVYGDELTFTTESSPNVLPAVTTDLVPDPAIGETYADVSGSFVAPAGTTVSETGFVYSEFSDPVLGDPDTYFIPLTDTDGAFETTLTGLSSHTTYYVRAYAVNENGIGYGGNVSFTTTGSLSIFPPAVVSSLTADPVTANPAAVTRTTTGAVALGREIFYSSTNKLPAEGGDGVLSVSYAFTDGPTKVITGLAPDTTYYLRGRATAAGGTKYYGGVLTITTDAYGLPAVANDTPPSDNISFDSAQVYAQVASNGMPVTKAAVVWSDSVENPTLGAPGVMSRQTDQYIDGEAGISYQLSGLKSGTTYYYALYAYNAGGWSSAPVQSFSTDTALEPVAAVTGVAYGATTAAVSARLTQDGEGNHAAYGLGLLVSEDPAATFITPDKLVYWYPGAVGDTFTANFTGLEPSTQYYARPYVSSVYDETYLGDSYAFTTQSTPLATVELYDPTDVTASSADFIVSVLSGGGSPVTERGLAYNTAGAPDLGDGVVVCTGAGTDPGQSAAQLTGLTGGTKYHVRAFATTENGTAYSDELFFTARDSVYTVTFDPNGGNVSPTSAQTGEDGKLASLPVPTRTDYTFNGWFTQASGGDPVTTHTSYMDDTAVYAHWTASGTYSQPTVVTVSADGVGDREVTLTGEVTAQGSSPVLECGFAISSVLPLPLYNGAESVWTEGCTGSFSLAVSELTPETRYYFRAYAISDENEPVSYGEVMQFTTLEDTTVYGVFTSPVTDLTHTARPSTAATR